MVEEHLLPLTDQITRIIQDGAARSEFVSHDSAVTSRVILSATSRFHHPAHASEWARPDIDTDFEGVWALISTGLTLAAWNG